MGSLFLFLAENYGSSVTFFVRIAFITYYGANVECYLQNKVYCINLKKGTKKNPRKDQRLKNVPLTVCTPVVSY